MQLGNIPGGGNMLISAQRVNDLSSKRLALNIIKRL